MLPALPLALALALQLLLALDKLWDGALCWPARLARH
jgi:hypothetical protein